MSKKGKKSEPQRDASPPGAPAPGSAQQAKELQPAWEAYERGDNRTARREARAVLARPDASEEARKEAQAMLERTGFEPLALAAVIVVSLVVAGILIALSLGHKFP
jgi:hypothetical protein